MEAEVRAIILEAVADAPAESSLFPTLLARSERVGGVDLDIPRRTAPARGADFST
jgi:plasmid stability protein